MPSTGSPDLYLPIFAGQGTSAASSSKTRHLALSDASSPSGSVLISACHDAFHQELSSLPPGDFSALDIDLTDFSLPTDLLSSPKDHYLHNAVVSGSTLFLLQILRYLAFVDATCISSGSLTPFSDVLKANLEHDLGILGFSSGILPACVVATSFNTLNYISKAVEAYRLAIWVGIRSHLYRVRTLNAAALDSNTDLPWSLVFMGIGRDEAEEAIAAFSKGAETELLHITAIMDGTCVTISGRPDILAAFSNFLSTNVNVVIHKTTLDALYHSPQHRSATRQQVLLDVASRNIHFPQFSDIQVPIRSTFTGDAITKDEKSGTLVELIVDMLLLHPVIWSSVVERVAELLPRNAHVGLLNVGPGLGLMRTTERAFPRESTTTIDLTSDSLHRNSPKQEPIAIIGMAVNMPGAPNVSKLWEVLEQGINTISEIPDHRFRVSDYTNSKTSKRTMKAHTGNFIQGADEFDNKFFKISPREAKSMDPQQRVLLHTAYEALEDSGYVPNATPTSRPENFGCYIGVATHDYLQNLRDDIDVYYSPGTLKAFLSGRISYAMQLSGPSIVVDTACSSSNVALYQGARALMNRDCDSALVGGVNIITSPDMFLGLDRGHFLSPTGQCKSFDATADGYSRGEGCGVFVLKRLSDALAENDRILGVIRGIEVNQSGLAHSITHPHAPTQASLFQRVLENSHVDPHRVNVIEAHGTGTQAGDPNELESIRSIFSVQRSSDNPLHITSIKANIGHLEAASGSAGLAKLLLMFQHQTIPRQISLRTLNPKIAPLESDNTVIDMASVPWRASSPGLTRIAMLNNFGAAGSNSTLLVEEHPRSTTNNPDGLHFVFGLSAKDAPALEKLRSKFLEYLGNNESTSLADIAYTTTARRQIYDHRLAISANNAKDLVIKLRRALTVEATPKNGNVVFVFSGQGGQYLGMGRSLYQTSAAFRSDVEHCHAILIKAGFPGVLAILNSDGETSGLTSLEEFEAYQACIFTLQYALAKLWMSWGIQPAAVLGHSLGEYAALVFAGVISVHDALNIVATRVRLMVRRCAVNDSGMIAVNLGPAAVRDVLRGLPQFSDLSIACFNSPMDCVLSGSLTKLKAFKCHLDSDIRCKNLILTVPFGYHSQAMAPLLDELNEACRRVVFHAPQIPIVSNVLGDVVFPGDSSVFDSRYFARHCAEPVQFEKGVQALVMSLSGTPPDAWIEIGPHTTTLPMLKANPALPRGSLFLASLRKQQDNWDTLTTSLTHMYTNGLNVQWRRTFEHLPTVTCISLPSYPFSPSTFWVEYKEPTSPEDTNSTTADPVLSTEYSMLSNWLQYPSIENQNTAIFETPIEQVAGWITGHSVGGMPLCPASVYVEQATSAIYLAFSHLHQSTQGSHIALRKMEFVKPLVHDPSISRTMITTIVVEDGSGTFSIASRMSPAFDDVIHAHGEYRLQPTASTVSKFTRTLPSISRYMTAVCRSTTGASPEVFSTRTAYEVIFPRVVDYSKEYRTMKSITVDASSMEGCADVRLPDNYDRGKFTTHPVFIDTLLHVAGFVANLQGRPNDAFICSEVGAVKVIPELVDNDASYTVYCTNAWVPEDDMVLADAYAILSGHPNKIVAHIKGMQFRRLRLDRFKKGLSLASGNHTRPPRAPSSVSFKVEQEPTPTPSSNIHDMVIRLISDTCDLTPHDLDINVDLASLGVDSLMSIEIFSRLARTFSEAKLSSQTLSFCTTVSDIIHEVSTKLNSNSTIGNDSPLTAFSGTSTPRTLVPDEAYSDSTQECDHIVKDILASVLDLAAHEIDDDADFDSLGLDSLTSIEALHALKTELGFELSSNIFTTFHTLRKLQSHLASQISKSSQLSQQKITAKQHVPTSPETILTVLRLHKNPVPIQSTSRGGIPIFLIHDGSGLVNYYERLSCLDRPVWAIHNPNFSSSQPWECLAQMARTYAKFIANVTSGPVFLGGWSFGGVAAYEVARHLELMGRTTRGLLLIDAPSPIDHVPLSDTVIESALNLDGRSSSSCEVRDLTKAQFRMNSRLLGDYKPEPFLRDCPPLLMLRSKEAFNPIGVKVPAWLSDRRQPAASTAGWEALSKRHVEIRDIPGNHFEPFVRSNLESVSAIMRDGCNYLERQ